MSLKLHNIGKYFVEDGHHHQVLDSINLEVKNGEFLCLMGPSGCGKSTLLRLIAGLIDASVGGVTDPPARVGFVFQNFALMPWLSVYENIAFGLRMRSLDENEIHQAVTKQIHEVGLAGLQHRRPKELSGGQKQRVGLARALAIDPDVLLLDEPFSALDTYTAAELREDLLRIWQSTGKTIIMVTHLSTEAAELGDRIVVLSTRPGQVVSIIENNLPRPRPTRDAGFFALVDRLDQLIRPTGRH
ncbi:MAG TPA: ABC transporter ATP-binding protein [Candidatus Nanoarchaeia archaeon]|nr:ABC transporter ATP-binding protein [Candidatus Nanoarchaeia archaeon]